MRNLITAQEVIDLAFAENSNMMAESISDTAIRIAEIKYIRPAFGVMYPLLADKYADYTNDYVKPALAYFVKCEIVSSIAIDMSNSGVAVANPQYQSAATDKQRQRLYDSEMSKAKTLLDFALKYIATHSEEFPDFSGEAPKKHHRVGGILLGNGTSRSQSASIAGEAFKAEFDGYLREMNEISEEVSKLKENAEKATENAEAATANTNEAIARAEQATADAEVGTEKANEAAYNANNAAQRANEEVENLREKADKNGYYPEMSVGMADNLVGRGDVQDAHINFRPSAGADNITDGAARIERIKGNSVVYNQWLLNSHFASTSNWAAYNAITTIESDGEKLTASISSDGSIAIWQSASKAKIKANHTYLVVADFEPFGSGTTWGIYMGVTAVAQFNGYLGRGKQHLFITAPATPQSFVIYPILKGGKSGNYAHIYSVQLIDLTQMFGAEVANNITSYEDYLQLKPMNIADEFAYNEGELIDMKVDSLISTSDNAYDYTEGYARVMGGVPYTITVDNRNDITPEEVYFSETLPIKTNNEDNIIYPNADGTYTFPSIGYAKASFQGYEVGKEDTICICLQHTYDKPHPPYQQEVKDLSFISEAFPEGMRSAGSAFDEILFNPTTKKWEAVKRIGEVDLGNIDWIYSPVSDSKPYGFLHSNLNHDVKDSKPGAQCLCVPYAYGGFVNDKSVFWKISQKMVYVIDSAYTDATTFKAAMQGVKLYYELAEPIVVELDYPTEETNMDYLVWDFGTEEAIATEPSAPFRADIIYEPNAVDDLRWAVAEIRNLKAQLEQMSASVTNLTE